MNARSASLVRRHERERLDRAKREIAWRAAAVRYWHCCVALGSTPPTPAELRLIEQTGPPPGFGVPRTTTDRTVWQVAGRG